MKNLQLNVKIHIAFMLALLALPLNKAKGQPKLMAGRFSVKVNLQKLKGHPSKIYFWYDAFNGREKITHRDSATIKNNAVVFNGSINEPHEAVLSIKPQASKLRVYEGDRLSFYLTAGVINIRTADSLNNYTQTGGSFIEDYRNFKKVKNFYDHKVIDLAIKTQQAHQNGDSTQYLQSGNQFDAMVKFYANDVCKKWIIRHPASPVALLPLRWYAGSVIDNPSGVDSLYNCLSPTVKKLPSAIDLKQRVDHVIKSAVGSQAPLFTLPDTARKPVSLASYQGKYVLLDFWASWCAPCRRENPNVIANFNKHHLQNFIVLSVSLDSPNGKNAWLSAIHTDGLGKWPNLSDLKGFNNAAALLYGVQAVPQNFLIDPYGKIIGKNLFGSELTNKLKTVLPE